MSVMYTSIDLQVVKPFLKWAGGKTQLLEQFVPYFPTELKNGQINKYCEPFLGSGAVFFFIAQNYYLEKAYLSDINEDLIATFLVVQRNVNELIDELDKLKSEYLAIDYEDREKYFYKIREKFNKEKNRPKTDRYSKDWIPRAAQLMFLNKTCFNGLFRLNRKGEFNVPFGRYKNPKIYSEEQLYIANSVLQIAEIFITDFDKLKSKINHDVFVYLDPPYRPISTTSSFTSYSKFDFTDDDQKRLAKFYKELSDKGNKLMLSNSDPKNKNPQDHFFEDLYEGFYINRVKANRMINCNGNDRGKINELVITNY